MHKRFSRYRSAETWVLIRHVLLYENNKDGMWSEGPFVYNYK